MSNAVISSVVTTLLLKVSRCSVIVKKRTLHQRTNDVDFNNNRSTYGLQKKQNLYRITSYRKPRYHTYNIIQTGNLTAVSMYKTTNKNKNDMHLQTTSVEF